MYKLVSLNICIGKFHTEKAAHIAADSNRINACVVKAKPYELPDFTISHEFQLYKLSNCNL